METQKTSIVDKYLLDNIDQILIRHLAQFPDTTVSELARVIDYSITGTQKRITKPAFKKALAEIQESTDEALKRISQHAILKLKSLIDADEPRISLKACEIVLNQFSQQRQTMGRDRQTITFSTQISDDGTMMREEIVQR